MCPLCAQQVQGRCQPCCINLFADCSGDRAEIGQLAKWIEMAVAAVLSILIIPHKSPALLMTLARYNRMLSNTYPPPMALIGLLNETARVTEDSGLEAVPSSNSTWGCGKSARLLWDGERAFPWRRSNQCPGNNDACDPGDGWSLSLDALVASVRSSLAPAESATKCCWRDWG